MKQLKYLGELSKTDVRLLEKISSNKDTKILEFGPGASTQVFAQCITKNSKLVSVETSNKWIQICKRNLQDLNIIHPVEFIAYDQMSSIIEKDFDIIFSDGKVDLRFEFAMCVWNKLKIGGKLLFHDTLCRAYLEKDVLSVVKEKYEEISSVLFNTEESNITIINKAHKRRYKNWNIWEKKENWMHNTRISKPNNWLELLIKQCNE